MNSTEYCIKYIQPQAHDSTFPAIVWVQFEDSHVCKLLWQKYSYLQNTHILQDWTPIFAQKRSFHMIYLMYVHCVSKTLEAHM